MDNKLTPTKVKLVANPAYRNAVGMPRPVCDVVTEDGVVIAQFMFERQMLDFIIILKEVDGRQWCADVGKVAADFGASLVQQLTDKTFVVMNMLASNLNLWIDWEDVFRSLSITQEASNDNKD